MSAKRAQEFLVKLPPLPENICEAKSEEKEEFRSRVEKVLESIRAELVRMNRDQAKVGKELGPKARKDLLAKSGLSEADANRLADKKTSKDEKRKIMDGYIQEKFGISMEDIEQLKQMKNSAQAKKAKDSQAIKSWARAYGNTQMAKGAYDTPEAKADMKRSKDLSAKSTEVKELMDKIDPRHTTGFAQLLDFREKESPKMREIREKKIMPLRDELSRIQPDERDKEARLKTQLREIEADYCRDFGGKYHAALALIPQAIKRLSPDYSRLERAQDELYRLQTGLGRSPVQPGREELSAVQTYADALKEAYSFDLRYSSEKGRETGGPGEGGGNAPE